MKINVAVVGAKGMTSVSAGRGRKGPGSPKFKAAVQRGAKALAKTKTVEQLKASQAKLEPKLTKIEDDYQAILDKSSDLVNDYTDIEKPTDKQKSTFEAARKKIDAKLDAMSEKQLAATLEHWQIISAIEILTKTTPKDKKAAREKKEAAEKADLKQRIRRSKDAERRYAKKNGVSIETARRDMAFRRQVDGSVGNRLGRVFDK